MIVTSIFGNEITVRNNDVNYIYRVSKPRQAEKILKNMFTSQAFAWLDKNGTFVLSY